jgi:2-polyprenyl-3-methyl-5-hydroxy-6-metoxy-1,4-benzoquinol methylase
MFQSIRYLLGRCKYYLFINVLNKFGAGYRISKSLWEIQYGSGKWDFWGQELARFIIINDFYEKYKKGGSIFDIGCGQGYLIKYLLEKSPDFQIKYTGIDISEKAIEQCNQLVPNQDFRAIDYDEQGLEGRYDVVIYNEVLEHFRWPIQTIKKSIKENLTPNGIVITSTYRNGKGNDKIRELIRKEFEMIEMKEAIKDETIWDVYVFKPKK